MKEIKDCPVCAQGPCKSTNEKIYARCKFVDEKLKQLHLKTKQVKKI